MEQSKVRLHGFNSHSCGYCKKEDDKKEEEGNEGNEGDEKEEEEDDGSKSYGVVSDYMTVEAYEKLMLMGWRRSGNYFYKPVMHQTCCPSYTIRLKASDFKPSKSQRKVLKQVENWLLSQSEATKIEITQEKACFTTEKFDLYKKYQSEVHNESLAEIKEKSFTRFLVESPLVDTTASVEAASPTSSTSKQSQPQPTNEKSIGKHDSTAPTSTSSSPAGDKTIENTSVTEKYGTFHQLYRLNGQLVAVGVVDVLPSGLSSVYFFYDVDYKHLVLGKFSALKELEYCLQNQLEYYYMGFYIHTCDKMKYKGDYKPSELLCPTSLQWIPLSSAVPLLNKFNFTPFREELAKRREEIAEKSESGQGSKSDGDIGEDKEKEEEKEEGDDSVTVKKRPSRDTSLEEFAPRFSYSTLSGANASSEDAERRIRSLAVLSVPLDIGIGKIMRLQNIAQAHQGFLKDLLQDWVANVGPAASKDFNVCFN